MSSPRPRILSISFTNFLSDARVLRQLDVLADFGDVTTIGFGAKPDRAFEHLEMSDSLASLPQTLSGVVRLALHMHRSVALAAPATKAALRRLDGREFDLVVANEARALPLAHAVAHGAPIWGDMHEWAPEERTQVLSWRLLVAPFMRYVCAEYLPKTAGVTTVSESVAKMYQEQFGVAADIVRNTIAFQNLPVSRVEPNRVRLVHSGGAVPGRNIEALIEATVAAGKRFSLDLYLIEARDGGKYLRTLRSIAKGSTQIVFHEPVAPRDLPEELNKYDLGVYLLPPLTPNMKYMLPNKFFDFVQARLGLIFGPSAETSALIERYELGVVTKDYSVGSLVAALHALSAEEIDSFKQHSDVAARELSSSEDEYVQRTLISHLISGK